MRKIENAAASVSIQWIRKDRFCQLTGVTSDAIQGKRKSGAWAEGVHFCIAPDGKMYINVKAYEAWVTSDIRR
jgi:hypothetical protein